MLGDFFPSTINPFYFNDTLAYLFHSDFLESQIKKEAYLWRDEAIKVDIPEGADVVYVNPPVISDIPLTQGGRQNGVEAGGLLSDYQSFDTNEKWQINPTILKKVVQDEKGNYYKIIKEEYDFLVKYKLPLPTSNRFERVRN